jgi:hypothetical protein
MFRVLCSYRKEVASLAYGCAQDLAKKLKVSPQRPVGRSHRNMVCVLEGECMLGGVMEGAFQRQEVALQRDKDRTGHVTFRA